METRRSAIFWNGLNITAIIFFILLVLCLLIHPDAFKTESPLVTNTNDYTEVGWRPIIGCPEMESNSHVLCVTVSINGATNDMNSYRECFTTPITFNPSNMTMWRTNETTGGQEIYIISKTYRWPTPHLQYFVLREARFSRSDR